MSIAAALEANLRERCQINLPNVSEAIVQDIRYALEATAKGGTGALSASVQVDPWVEAGDRYTTEVSAGRGLEPDYARFQDEGVGIYGPTGQRIVPLTPGGVLVFDWPEAGGTVFFKSVAGFPGKHYFTEPMPDRVQSAFLAGWA